MNLTHLNIRGMTCSRCADTIEEALNRLPGVRAEVSYDDASATVTHAREVTRETLLRSVKAAEY